MEIEKGKFYLIRFDIGENKSLSYNCEILENSEEFITFRDKFGKVLSFNKNKIISIEELKKNE